EDYEIDYNFNLADVEQSLPGSVALRGLLNVQPKVDTLSYPGSPVTQGTSAGGTTPNPKGHATIFADYTLGNWSIDGQIHWFSGVYLNTLPTAPLYYASPRVPSFTTVDFTVSKNMNFDNGSNAQVYVSVQNIANANPPITTGSSGNPGYGIPVLAGESVMGRYFTIGLRGNL
ncbi:MAG TPA: hypothetical protein VGC16_07210, partial [Rhizomicrobium sp.]